MKFPTRAEIKAFDDLLSRDGINTIFEKLVDLSTENDELKPLVHYLMNKLKTLLSDELPEIADGYVTGFVSCFEVFRRKSELITDKIEDIEEQINSLNGWIDFLENENLSMKEKIDELTRENKNLSKVPSVQEHGDDTDST